MSRQIRIGVQIENNRAHGRALLEGIANYALERTDWILEQVSPDQLVDTRLADRFDGLIVRVMDEQTATALRTVAIPVIDTYGRIDDNPLSSIRLDDTAIATMAAEYFIVHRYTDFAYCGMNGLRFSDARGEAFANALAERGHACSAFVGSADLVSDTFFRNENVRKLKDGAALLKWTQRLPKPVAVFCCNDLRAHQLLTVCTGAGIGIPQDVAVLGVDNDTIFCTFANPPLSSIDTDSFALGRAAAHMLDEALASGGREPRRILHAPRKVVERTSTGFYPFKTPWLSDAVIFINRHLGEGISAADVIRRLGYSHTVVNRAFNAELGCSVQHEIIRLRLERACRLLRETDLSAAAIARDCGYPSPQYFSHFFSSKFATTPDKWRNERRSNPDKTVTE